MKQNRLFMNKRSENLFVHKQKTVSVEAARIGKPFLREQKTDWGSGSGIGGFLEVENWFSFFRNSETVTKGVQNEGS